MQYDVFISCKSEDYKHAEEIYEFLEANGIHTFLASKELRKSGDSEYRKAISKALKSTYHMIVFASQAEYIDTTWVYYEWDWFINAQLKGFKPGQIVTILKDVNVNDVNSDLWKYESFVFSNYKDNLLSYVETPAYLQRMEEEQKRKEEEERARRQQEEEKRKRKEAKGKLIAMAEDYRGKVAELNSVEAKKLVAALRAVGVVAHSCPVCNARVDVDKSYCPTCGWGISPIDDIEGAEYLSLVDKRQLEVVSGVYGRCLAAEKRLAQIDGQTSNSQESQALVADLTERIVKLESQVSEKTNELQNAISERNKVEQSSREAIMKLQMVEVSLQEKLAAQRAQMDELRVLIDKKEQMEKSAQKECERLKKQLAQIAAGKVLTSNKCEKVDLGLSVCWADRNVGASSPEDYGDYFAWGETEPKKEYTKENYKHYDTTTQAYLEIGKDISGGKYDVAHLKWGDDWRMPTKKEIDELAQKCRWQWTEVDGVCGRLITGPSGNTIFLPAAGYREGVSSYAENQKGRYWSGTGSSTLSGEAERICFGSSSYMFTPWNNHCYLGSVIRPVASKTDSIEELPNKLLVEKALAKDVDACVELARRYYYGLHGYEKNIEAANNYLKKVGLPLYEVFEPSSLPKSLKFSYEDKEFYMVLSPDETYYMGNMKAVGKDFSWLNSSWLQVGGSAAVAAGAVALGVLAWPMAVVLFLRAISSWTNEKDKAKSFKVDQPLCDELSSTSGYKFAKPTDQELEGVKQEEKDFCIVLRIKDNPNLISTKGDLS